MDKTRVIACIRSSNGRSANNQKLCSLLSWPHSFKRQEQLEKKQYTVYEINTVDVIDWKRYGQDIGLHAWRDALDGNSLVWTKVMSVALEKRKGKCDILFKHSHMEEFSVVSKPPKRQKDKYKSKTLPRPQNAYASVPKLSLPKYNDLIALCSGPKPVVYQQDQIMFYSNLPHTQK
ncbi:hypothetical protein PoB_000337800 [Plakobranchus ocellatus]|uniref:Uncharacterized protein n=1 Tax=Plakobranchus ocellatus TaxID=259542 RepID=A0AAV3Y3G6_9GAST|nr:hypothetical protein PoB_000337800 [Plakobranchus ocellatus]